MTYPQPLAIKSTGSSTTLAIGDRRTYRACVCPFRLEWHCHVDEGVRCFVRNITELKEFSGLLFSWRYGSPSTRRLSVCAPLISSFGWITTCIGCPQRRKKRCSYSKISWPYSPAWFPGKAMCCYCRHYRCSHLTPLNSHIMSVFARNIPR